MYKMSAYAPPNRRIACCRGPSWASHSASHRKEGLWWRMCRFFWGLPSASHGPSSNATWSSAFRCDGHLQCSHGLGVTSFSDALQGFLFAGATAVPLLGFCDAALECFPAPIGCVCPHLSRPSPLMSFMRTLVGHLMPFYIWSIAESSGSHWTSTWKPRFWA